MNRKIIFLVWLCIPLLCMAENLPREYDYDAAGNRILRKVITVQPTPPSPQDTTDYSQKAPLVAEYYVEKIAQTEIKIYPNPTTEKVNLEITGWENLQRGSFKLYSLTGQLLQEHQVHSQTTTISLTNLPKGTYILKVNINDRTEEWKVIKN